MKLKISIIAAAIALGVLLYLGAFTCKAGEAGLRIGDVVRSGGC